MGKRLKKSKGGRKHKAFCVAVWMDSPSRSRPQENKVDPKTKPNNWKPAPSFLCPLSSQKKRRLRSEMATGAAAAETMLRCVLEGSLLMQEMEAERRPYHRNCSCALHSLKGRVCSPACSRARNVSFTKRKTWNDCSLSMAISHFSSRSSLGNMGSKTSMVICDIDDDHNM
ncbi:hypothetical protein V6N13_136215 [Hibiscus sabdariffa]|uniref:Uncharacterized protein n=1 Tax=Hibiscus sabdariffa TaxID=183260 RepID=A0ABR2DP98_9ROSI